MFPSPYGDYGSYQGTMQEQLKLEQEVSVPLRGLWFLSWSLVFHSVDSDRFRPLTGIMVLIYHTAEKIENNNKPVSVPLRGLWFLSRVAKIRRRSRNSFRPLTGIMVLIYKTFVID